MSKQELENWMSEYARELNAIIDTMPSGTRAQNKWKKQYKQRLMILTVRYKFLVRIRNTFYL